MNSALASLPPPVSAAGYISSVVYIAWDDAAYDGATCAGCDVPACIQLSRVDMVYDVNHQPPPISLTQPDLLKFVTYYGGTPNCLGAVPTRNATWGQVKALYR